MEPLPVFTFCCSPQTSSTISSAHGFTKVLQLRAVSFAWQSGKQLYGMLQEKLLSFLFCEMANPSSGSVPVFSKFSDQVMRYNYYYYGLLSTAFLIEEDAKFQLEVSKNRDVTFPHPNSWTP